MRASSVLPYSTRRRIQLLAAEVDVFCLSTSQRATLDRLIDLADELDGDPDHEADYRHHPAADVDHDFLEFTLGLSSFAPASPARVRAALIATRDALEEAGAGFSATLAIDHIIAGRAVYASPDSVKIVENMSFLLESMNGDVARAAALVAAVYTKARDDD